MNGTEWKGVCVSYMRAISELALCVVVNVLIIMFRYYKWKNMCEGFL